VLVTLLTPIVLLLLERVPLPEIDLDAVASSTSFYALFVPSFSAVMMGIAPYMTASALVEIATAVIPAWRLRRADGGSGYSGRARATAIVAVIIATLQAWGLTTYLGQADLFLSMGLVAQATMVATLVAGTFVVVALAGVIQRWGLGFGAFTILGATALIGIVRSLPGVSPQDVWGIAAFVIAFGITLAVLRARRFDPAMPGRTVLPALVAGLIPVDLGWLAASWLAPEDVSSVMLGAIPLAGRVVVPRIPNPAALESQSFIQIGAALAVAALATWTVGAILLRPRTLSAHWTRANVAMDEGAVAAHLRLGVVVAIVWIFAMLLLDEGAERVQSRFVLATTGALFGALCLEAARSVRALRASRPEVVVWADTRAWAVPLATAALTREGIAHHVEGGAVLALFPLIGPAAPAIVRVAAADTDRALDVLRHVFAETEPAPVSDSASASASKAASPSVSAPTLDRRLISGLGAAAVAGALMVLFAPRLRDAVTPYEGPPPPPAKLEFVFVDDETDPLASLADRPPDDVPTAIRFERENAPVGQGTRVASYAAVESAAGISNEQAKNILEGWLATVPVPPDRRWAVEATHHFDDAGELVQTGWRSYLLKGAPVITEADVADAFAMPTDDLGGFGVSLSFTPHGAERFAEATRNNIRRRFAIVVNGVIESAPVIQSEISGGSAVISMGRKSAREQTDEARRLAASLRPAKR
jgi:hypothetical protein